jgi:hypothetical protein
VNVMAASPTIAHTAAGPVTEDIATSIPIWSESQHEVG